MERGRSFNPGAGLERTLEVIDGLGRRSFLLKVENAHHFPAFFTKAVDFAGKFCSSEPLAGVVVERKMLPFHDGFSLCSRGSVGDIFLGPGGQEDESEGEDGNDGGGDAEF